MALIALAVTVTVGVGLGVWMVIMALGSPVSTSADHGHEDAGTAAHDHAGAGDEHAGVVAMPGLAGAASATPDAMAGMSAADMAAMAQPSPAQPTPDTMAGMSAADMAAMNQPIPAQPTPETMAGMSAGDMAAMNHDGATGAEPTRPLGLTLAGFALLNLAVLVAALAIGRRRRARAGGPGRPERGARPRVDGVPQRTTATPASQRDAIQKSMPRSEQSGSMS